MSKCYEKELSKLYEYLLLDAADAYPALRGSFERDLVALLHFIEHRGIHTLCVDLPAAGKHLDRCLDRGEYIPSGLPTTSRCSGRVPVPKLFQGLYKLIFDEVGFLREEDCDVQAIVLLRQLLYCAKKAKLDCSRDQVIDSIVDFIEVDASLSPSVGVWEHPICAQDFSYKDRQSFPIHGLYKFWADRSDEDTRGFNTPAESRRFLNLMDAVSAQVCAALGHFDRGDWRSKHGPGAIAQTSAKVNKFHWWNWSDDLESAFPIADVGFYNYCSWASSVYLGEEFDEGENSFVEPSQKIEIPNLIPASRMIDVPKTFTKPRLIAAEPSENMWCQQSIWRYFSERVGKSWLNQHIQFRDQTLNQRLAREGSEDGSLITVDLSAASDRVSCSVVECVFGRQPELLHALAATRTRYVDITPYKEDLMARGISTESYQNLLSEERQGTWLLELNKFSTMGNACTFPVESLVFLTVALAATLFAEGRTQVSAWDIKSSYGHVSVFGDDIIVPKYAGEALNKALEFFEFRVNTDKSFSGIGFRESCGVDAFRGVNVTPVYWKQPCDGRPESVASTVEVRNHFYQKWFLRTAHYLSSTLPGWLKLPQVNPDSGVLGLSTWNAHAAAELNERKSFLRWNKVLHRYEIYACTLTGIQEKIASDDDSALFQYFTEDPSPFEQWASGVVQRPVLKMRNRWVPVSSGIPYLEGNRKEGPTITELLDGTLVVTWRDGHQSPLVLEPGDERNPHTH